MAEGLVKVHIVQKVVKPKPEKRDIQPYSEADIRLFMNSLEKSRPYKGVGKVEVSNRLPHPERNRAVLLLLLDTGLRASELCDLRIHQVDVRNRHVIVMGKGSKERILPFCARTGQALWRYLSTRKDEAVDKPLFVTEDGTPFDRQSLRKTLIRIGSRAGIRQVGVHRFRHTFAINYFRNGGDPYSLQRLLGHSTMEMVKHYLAISQSEIDRNHKLASPVDHWRL